MSVTRQQSVSKELSPEPTEALRASAHLGIWAVSTVDTHYCLFCTSRVLFCQLTCKNTKHMTVISSETEAAINGREKEKGSKQWTLSAVEYGMYLAWAARNGLTGSRNSARCEWESRGLTCVKLWESENEQVKGARPVRRQVWEMVNLAPASDVHRSPWGACLEAYFIPGVLLQKEAWGRAVAIADWNRGWPKALNVLICKPIVVLNHKWEAT